MKEHLKTAISTAGGLKPFTQAVGAPSTHAVKGWLMARVPADYCPAIERVTGVKCEALRPDIEWGVLRGTAKKQEARRRDLAQVSERNLLGETTETTETAHVLRNNG